MIPLDPMKWSTFDGFKIVPVGDYTEEEARDLAEHAARCMAAYGPMIKAIEHAIAYLEKPNEIDETDTLQVLEKAIEGAGT